MKMKRTRASKNSKTIAWWRTHLRDEKRIVNKSDRKALKQELKTEILKGDK